MLGIELGYGQGLKPVEVAELTPITIVSYPVMSSGNALPSTAGELCRAVSVSDPETHLIVVGHWRADLL